MTPPSKSSPTWFACTMAGNGFKCARSDLLMPSRTTRVARPGWSHADDEPQTSPTPGPYARQAWHPATSLPTASRHGPYRHRQIPVQICPRRLIDYHRDSFIHIPPSAPADFVAGINEGAYLSRLDHVFHLAPKAFRTTVSGPLAADIILTQTSLWC